MTVSPVLEVTVIDGPPVPRESNSCSRPSFGAEMRHTAADHIDRTSTRIIQPEAGLSRQGDPAVAGACGEGHATAGDPHELNATAAGAQGGVALQICDHDGTEIGGCCNGCPDVSKLNTPGVSGRPQRRVKIRDDDGPDCVMDRHPRPGRDGDAQVELDGRDQRAGRSESRISRPRWLTVVTPGGDSPQTA